MLIQYANILGSLLLFIIGAYLISQDFRSPFQTWTIDNPANAWSSVLYALPIAPVPVKIPLVILSIVSFGHWSNPIVAIDFLDITSIYWIITIVSTYILPNAKHNNIAIIVVDGCFIIYIATVISLGYENIFLDYYKTNLTPISSIILITNTLHTSIYYGHRRLYLLGNSMIVVGFGLKLLTMYGHENWGTSLFHASTAGGIAILLSPRLMTMEPPPNKPENMLITLENTATV